MIASTHAQIAVTLPGGRTYEGDLEDGEPYGFGIMTYPNGTRYEGEFVSGYREGRGNNTPFGKWYGLNFNPWCAMFESYCATKAGLRFRYASVAMIVDDARWGRHGLHLTSKPVPGDVFCIRNDHTGFVLTSPGRSGFFTTIEGNSSDRVQSRRRHRFQITHFVRIAS